MKIFDGGGPKNDQKSVTHFMDDPLANDTNKLHN